MRLATLIYCCVSTTVACFASFVAVEQNKIISSLKTVAERGLILDGDEYLGESASEAYVRGYHAATEDIGCPPDTASRNEAVERWKKNAGFIQVDYQKKQEEIAEKIKRAVGQTETTREGK